MAGKLKKMWDVIFGPDLKDKIELPKEACCASPNTQDADRLKALETVLNGAFYITLNMNDTFAFACADYEDMSVSDFDLMASVIAKYGQDALTAYVAVKRGQEPISCKCDHKNERYQAAKGEIQKIKEAKPDFMVD